MRDNDHATFVVDGTKCAATRIHPESPRRFAFAVVLVEVDAEGDWTADDIIAQTPIYTCSGGLRFTEDLLQQETEEMWETVGGDPDAVLDMADVLHHHDVSRSAPL